MRCAPLMSSRLRFQSNGAKLCSPAPPPPPPALQLNSSNPKQIELFMTVLLSRRNAILQKRDFFFRFSSSQRMRGAAERRDRWGGRETGEREPLIPPYFCKQKWFARQKERNLPTKFRVHFAAWGGERRGIKCSHVVPRKPPRTPIRPD